MLEFQRTSLDITRSFIESQQRVMMAYLTRGEVPGELTYSQVLPAQIQSPQIQNYSMPVQQEMRVAAAQYQPIVGVPQQEPVSKSLIEAAASAPAPAAAVQSQTTYENLAAAAQSNAPVPVSAAAPAQQSVQAVSSSSISSSDGSSPEQLIESLISIVADRTGYPPEMLDPTLDLEADLGIDSIKRVEILNSFRKLLPEEKQNALEDGIERLAGVKTLQGIMDWIRTELDPHKPASAGIETSVSQLDSVSAQAG